MSDLFQGLVGFGVFVALFSISSGLEKKWKAQARLIEAQAEKIEEDDTLHGPGDDKSFGA